MASSTATLAVFFPRKYLRKICHLTLTNHVIEGLIFLCICDKVKIVEIKLYVKGKTVNKDKSIKKWARYA